MRELDVGIWGLGGETLFGDGTFRFEPGLTVLVGCNGAGKTTLMELAMRRLRAEGVPCLQHCCEESWDRAGHAAMTSGDVGLTARLADAAFLSEGERASAVFSILLGEMGRFVLSECDGAGEAWVFIDGIDSALSVDAVRDVRGFFLETMLPTAPPSIDLYVVVSANSYELARGCDCIDVQTSHHLTFTCYAEFEEHVMLSRRRKDERLDERHAMGAVGRRARR